MRNILFVAFEFPPLSSGGVHRPLKFVKYLPEFGINPVVVTTDTDSFRQVMDAPFDDALLNDLPPETIIERIPCRPTFEKDAGRFQTWRRIYFSLVEQQSKSWKVELEKRLPAIIQKYQPVAIIVTLPPFGMGPLWCDLAKQFRLPLVVDFRDAWSQWRVSPYGSWFHYILTLGLERRCLTEAAKVVCSSDQIRNDLLNIHKKVVPEKLVTITNGYDAEVVDWSLQPRAQKDKQNFTIGYVGNFYYDPASREAMMMPWWKKKPHRMIQYAPRKEDWLYRSPYFFFRAVATLLGRRPELKPRLVIRFAGRRPQWIDQQVAEFSLQDNVEFAGYLSHDKVLAFQEECDALLVTSSKVIGGRDYSIAGKTFEYFTFRRPILGFVTEGAQKDMLVKSGMAILCDPDDSESSAELLAKMIDDEILLTPDTDFLKSLHRKKLAEQLAELLFENSPRG